MLTDSLLIECLEVGVFTLTLLVIGLLFEIKEIEISNQKLIASITEKLDAIERGLKC